MKKINFLILAVIILVLLNLGTLGFLFYSQKKERVKTELHPGKDPAAFISDQLKLDAQQQAQFEELRRKHQQDSREMHREDERLHDAFFDLLKTGQPDRNKADSLAGLVAAQQKRLALNAFDHFTQLRAICRDDQKELFDKNINEITKIVAKGRPPGGPPPPPPHH